jgi:hypothetical protein
MAKDYRRVILAAFTALILANASGEGRRGLELSKIQPPNDSRVGSANCPIGRDDRKSDLCAQWKAADAAAESAAAAQSANHLAAQANLIGWIGIGLGLITMCAAIAAALFAKLAAHHTKRGVDETEKGVVQAKRSAELSKAALAETRKTARLQLRAYVGIDRAAIEGIESAIPGEANRRITIVIKNFGQTPAVLEAATLGITFKGDANAAPSSVPPEAVSNLTLNPGHTASIASDFYVFSRPASSHKIRYVQHHGARQNCVARHLWRPSPYRLQLYNVWGCLSRQDAARAAYKERRQGVTGNMALKISVSR